LRFLYTSEAAAYAEVSDDSIIRNIIRRDREKAIKKKIFPSAHKCRCGCGKWLVSERDLIKYVKQKGANHE
jgi:hypothetical protein